VEGITKSAAIGLAGRGVRVNVVGPGPVERECSTALRKRKENKANFLDAQVPNRRIDTPEEIGNAWENYQEAMRARNIKSRPRQRRLFG